MLTSEKETKDWKDIVTKYRNCITKYSHMSLDEYFYQVFFREVLNEKEYVTDRTKHRILLPVGKNCKTRYPVTYEYAKSILIQYKPWTKEKPLT